MDNWSNAPSTPPRKTRKRTRITNDACHSSMKSATPSPTTNSKVVGVSTSSSTSDTNVSKSGTVSANQKPAISARRMKELYVSLYGEQPSPVMNWEHRAFEKLQVTLRTHSVREGHNHFSIQRRPDLIIKQGIKDLLFADDSYLGRMHVGAVKRCALAADPGFLIRQQDMFMDWLEDECDVEATENFDVLLFSAFNAGLNGHCKFQSPLLQALAEATKKLPRSVVQMLLTSNDALEYF